MYSQNQKELKATRITNPPKIDGQLDDGIWKELPKYGDFYMLQPSNEGLAPEDRQSDIQFAYDDKAIYIAAYMYDSAPDKILKQFSQRDNIFVQADNIFVGINTLNDGINETRFWVTSAGTIGDSRVSQNDEDFNFNVVFECRVSIDDKGWYAEFKIPYRALRFPEVDVQNWSINVGRRLSRQNENHTWNYVDRSKGRQAQYNGLLSGITNIDPPTRLTFFPFAQALFTDFEGENSFEFAGGLDIKYGITDSFTLDAQLIPDFGQVAFDAVRLNLGPFEQTFSENRAFFTEGTELFNIGDIFFSRRIGGPPSGSGDLGENEEVLDEFPGNVDLINSIKVSGRTKNKLGIGVLNSVTASTEIRVQDTLTGETRDVVVEPITNYNVLVFDQQFNQNSSISLVNTNVLRSGSEFRDANVSALAFDIADKQNKFRYSGRTVYSLIREPGNTEGGFRTEFDFNKIKGNWRYNFSHDFADTSFDSNDLGLNFRNNFNSFGAGGSYEIFEPQGIFNGFRHTLNIRHRRLYRPGVHTNTSFNYNNFFFTRERFAFGANTSYNTENNDFFEPRLEGRFVTFSPNWGGGFFISTDFRKKFALDFNLNGRTFFGNQDQEDFGVSFSPRYRFSDKLLLVLSTSYDQQNRNFGWVDNTDTEVFLGQRDITTIENTINLSYNFDPFKAIDLRFRNFWSTADYSANIFYELNDDGTRTQIFDYDINEQRNPNTNFNIWNLDLSFRWRFAPGSEATLLYRNQIFNSDTQSTLNYTESLSNLFNQPIQHTVSLRITYFVDYNDIKGLF